MPRYRFRDTVLDVDIDPARIAADQPPLARVRKALIDETGSVQLVDEYLRHRLGAAFGKFGHDYIAEMSARIDRIFGIRDELAGSVDAALRGETVHIDVLQKKFGDLSREMNMLASPGEAVKAATKLDAPAEPPPATQSAEPPPHRPAGGGRRPPDIPGQLTRRLRQRGHARLLEDLEEIAAHDPELFDRRATELARLTDQELDGLEQIARLPDNAYVEWGDTLDTVNRWTAADRAEVLGVIADVGPQTTAGLEEVLRGIFTRGGQGGPQTSVQGGWGQLYAARTVVRAGGRNLRFEITELVGGMRRDVDIFADIGGRTVRVEVKTNLPPVGGGVAQATAQWNQIGKDLAIHAASNYRDLMYMYNPSVQAQLPGLGQQILALFGGPGLAPDPILLGRLTAMGINVNAARTAFVQWLQTGGFGNGGLTTYAP